MRILFANSAAFLPQMVGGIEISTLDLCRTLQQQGHQPVVMSSLGAGDFLWLSNRIKAKLLKKKFPSDRRYGLRIYRGWWDAPGAIAEVANEVNPDAVVVQGGSYISYEIAAQSARHGLPTYYYTHDLGVILSGAALPDMTGVTWIANSAFTVRTLKERLGIDCDMVPPLMRPESYAINATGKMVAMINPRPEKGGDLALQIAALCPEIPFLFVEAWSGAHPEVQKLKQQAAKLANVTWSPTQSDMRSIYGKTRLLLVPSQCEETWGRVVTEAQFLGIPALASRIGALPETVGPAGELQPADAPSSQWAEALKTMYNDEQNYRRYMLAAKTYAAREEISPQHIATKFVSLLANKKTG